MEPKVLDLSAEAFDALRDYSFLGKFPRHVNLQTMEELSSLEAVVLGTGFKNISPQGEEPRVVTTITMRLTAEGKKLVAAVRECFDNLVDQSAE